MVWSGGVVHGLLPDDAGDQDEFGPSGEGGWGTWGAWQRMVSLSLCWLICSLEKVSLLKKKKSFVGWCTLSSKRPIGLFNLEAFLVVKSVFSQRLPFLLVLSLLSLYTNLSLWMLTTMGLSNKWWVWEEVLTDACQWNNAFWFGLKSAWGNQWGN